MAAKHLEAHCLQYALCSVSRRKQINGMGRAYAISQLASLSESSDQGGCYQVLEHYPRRQDCCCYCGLIGSIPLDTAKRSVVFP